MVLVDSFTSLIEQWFGGTLATAATSITILIVGLIAGMIGGSVVQKILHQLEIDRILRKINIPYSAEKFLGTATSVIIYVASITLAISQFGFAPLVFNVLLIILSLVVIFSFIIAIKDIIPNIICGIILFRRKEFRVGMVIQVDDIIGDIQNIDLFHVVLNTGKGERIIIPNTLLFKKDRIKIKIKNRKKQTS